jgi:hypothetical protein
MKSKLLSGVVAVLFIGMLIVSTIQTVESRTAQNPISLLTIHAPIRINSDAQFTAPNGVSKGTGSLANPYVIENLQIDGNGYRYCLYIGNTTKHFVISNCSLYGANSSYVGHNLWIVNAKNGTIHNNTIFNAIGYSIYMAFCSQFNVTTNTIRDSYDTGISIEGSCNNTIANNTIHGMHYNGIYVGLAFDDPPMHQFSCKYNLIYGNMIYSNGIGISLSNPSINNTMWKNALFNNSFNAQDATLDMNNPNGTNIWWQTYNDGGNWWGDYDGIDIMSGINQNVLGSDGIGDTPYYIYKPVRDVLLYVRDQYPLVNAPFYIPDIIVPTINFTSPTTGQTNVSISIGEYSIQFSEPMNSSVGMFVTNLPNLTFDWSNDTIWVNGTFSVLDYNTTYYANLTGFTDLAGNPLSTTNLTFTTELETPTPIVEETLTDIIFSLIPVLITLLVVMFVLRSILNITTGKKKE